MTPGSKAALANLYVGDFIVAIDGEGTENMTHLEAQNKIKSCVDELPLSVNRSEAKVWSPLVSEEGKTHPYKMNLASEPQEAKPIGSAHNRSAMPFTAGAAASNTSPKVVTSVYNNPAGLYSSENIQSFNTAVEARTSSAAQEPNKPSEPQKPASVPAVHQDSEVFKMLQENQDSHEPPKQSTSFRVLQEILEGEGDSDKPSGFRSVKAPTTKVASSLGGGQKLPVCDQCGAGIVGIFVKLRDQHRHPECYVCTDCGTNLKQKGHFFVEDKIYCETHARERATPPEGYDVVTVFPK